MNTKGPLAWARRHPIATALLVATEVLLGAVTAVLPPEAFGVMVVFIIAIAVWWVAFGWFGDKLGLPLALLLLLPSPSKADEQPILPWVIGGVVLVGGSYVAYKVVRFCQHHFPPPPTNDTPAQVYGAGDDYAAAWTYAPSGSCQDAPKTLQEPPGGVLAIEVWPEGSELRSVAYTASQGPSVDFGTWEAGLSSVGLAMNSQGYGQSFSLNGVPVCASEVPIAFNPSANFIAIGYPGWTVSIEESGDLLTWEPLVTVSLPLGKRLRLEDVGQPGAVFYRFSLR